MADNEAAAQTGAAQNFGIQRTYLKDVSFETPMGAKVFTLSSFQPQIGLDVNTQAKPLGDNVHEVVLTITVTAKVEDEVVYLSEMQQAGIFTISGFPEEQLRMVLATVCPNFLFPYAREALDNLIIKGSFPALNLAPIDFEGIYRQQQAAQAQASEGEGDAPTLN